MTTTTIPTYLALELAASALVDTIGEAATANGAPPEAGATWERLADAIADVCTALGHSHAAYQARAFLRPVLAEAPTALEIVEGDGLIPAADVGDLALDFRSLIFPAWDGPANTGDDLGDLAHALRILADEMGGVGGWEDSIVDIVHVPDIGPIAKRVEAAADLVDATRDRIAALEAEVEELRERVGKGDAARGVLAALSQIRKRTAELEGDAREIIALADDAARTFSTAADVAEDGGDA